MSGDYASFLAAKAQSGDWMTMDSAAVLIPVKNSIPGPGLNFWASVLGPNLDEFRLDHEVSGPLHYIYGLHDPRTGELRYIGKSDRPRERLTNQMNERANTYRCHWLQELRAAGLRPIQVIFDACGEDWQTVERAYIAAAREAGHPLVNGTDGGDGVCGLSGESLARLRATWKGRKHKPESLAKMAAASRGRRHTQEWRDDMRARMREREFSPEHRQRIRAAIQKLTDDQVREIRVLLVARVSQYVIAEQFGIHQGSVSNIARGITYQGVGMPPSRPFHGVQASLFDGEEA